MASFVVALSQRDYAYSTIRGYVWGVCEHHIRNGYPSPLTNVRDWSSFMAGVMVQVFRPVQHRRMMPFKPLVCGLTNTNFSLRRMILCGCVVILYLFTMCRGVEFLPKTKTSFDKEGNLRRKDISLHDDRVEVGVGKIKQDQRSERAAVGSDGREWKPIGRVANPLLDALSWLLIYVEASSWSDGDRPLFYVEDGSPYTLPEFLDDLRQLLVRGGLTVEESLLYAVHGLRVLGYNLTKGAAGEDVAILIGGWGSEAHRTYNRETFLKILSAPQKAVYYAMEQMGAHGSLPPMPLDYVQQTPPTGTERPLPAGPSTAPVCTDNGTSAEPQIIELADGITRHTRTPPSGKSYSVYFANGAQYSSLKRARESLQTTPTAGARAVPEPAPSRRKSASVRNQLATDLGSYWNYECND